VVQGDGDMRGEVVGNQQNMHDSAAKAKWVETIGQETERIRLGLCLVRGRLLAEVWDIAEALACVNFQRDHINRKTNKMPNPIKTVTAFCAEFSKDHGRSAIHKWFTPDTIWVNEGISTTTGIDEAIATLEAVEKAVGINDAQFELLAIAADGNRVLTERLDRFQRADGSEIAAAKVMGIFEVEGDHISAKCDACES